MTISRTPLAGLAAALLAALAVAGTPRAEEQRTLLAFGDSLSDTGRLFAEYGPFVHPSFAAIYVNPEFSSGSGAFSNGPVWTEYLSISQGATLDNRAYAGAGTGDFGEPARFFLLPPDAQPTGEIPTGVLSQVGEFLGSDLATAPRIGENDIVIVWAGANNYFFGDFFPNISNDPFVVVGDLMMAIDDLLAAGARTILIPNLPDLGRLPLRFDIGPEPNARLSAATRAHNALIDFHLQDRRRLTDARLIVVDVYTAFNEILADPRRFGFTNATDSCVLVAPGLPIASLSGLCVDENGDFDATGFVFWDRVHPTTQSHAMLAEFAESTMRIVLKGFLLANANPQIRAFLARAQMRLIAARLNGDLAELDKLGRSHRAGFGFRD